MATEIRKFRPPGLKAYPDPVRPSIQEIDIYGALLSDAKNRNTQAARVFDMTSLAHYLGLADPAEAATLLCSGTSGQANAVALGFKRHCIDLGQSSGTINRRLCTLRKLVTLARRLGAIGWALEVDGMPEQVYRDTSGPGHDGWMMILELATAIANMGSAKGARDLAMVRLMHDNGLRVGEVVSLDLADLDLSLKRVGVVGKGKRERQWITINGPTTRALEAWIALRGTDPGPAFIRLSRPDATGKWAGGAGGGEKGRIVTRGVYRVVRDLGEAVGVKCNPHGLRHAGATRLLDITNGDVRAVQRWTRHKKVDTVIIYDDNRRDMAGELSQKLGEDL